MVHYLGDLNENMLEIKDNKGNSQVVPIVGMFKNELGYYVVIRVMENQKEEYVMYKVLKKASGEEYIQVITDKNEWTTAYNSWISLNVEAMGHDEVHIL